MIRIGLAVSGGIIAAVIAAIVEDSLGTPTFVQLLAMAGTIALILLLTAARFPGVRDDPAELLRQLDHHRRELYRLQARYQRKGVLTPAEVSAWFRNKRTIARLKKQLQNTETPYQPDAIDTAPPLAPVGLPTRAREYVRQPAVSVFIILFLVSLALAYPLSAAAQFVLKDYLVTASPFSQPAEPDAAPVVAETTATNTPQPTTNTPTPTQTKPASSNTPTPTTQPTIQPTTTATAAPTETPTAAATATTQPTDQPTTRPTDQPTTTPTRTPSPAGTPLPTLPPAPTATATFLPVGTLPPECGGSVSEAEPNNIFETAQGPLAPDATICGYLDDAFDFYYVEVPAPGQLTVTLLNVEMEPGVPPLNLLKLFTAGTAPMDWCCITRRDRIELTIDVNFGRYYILVDAREVVGLPYVLMVGYGTAGS